MFKFKEGDLVLVRPDLEEKKYLNFEGNKHNSVVKKMIPVAGLIFEIEHVCLNGIRHYLKKFPIFSWSDRMLIPMNKETLFGMLLNKQITEKEYEKNLKHINNALKE